MDANPWTYAIASVEMRREGKVADDPPPGLNQIANPRHRQPGVTHQHITRFAVPASNRHR